MIYIYNFGYFNINEVRDILPYNFAGGYCLLVIFIDNSRIYDYDNIYKTKEEALDRVEIIKR